MALAPRIVNTVGTIDQEGHTTLTVNYEVQVSTDATTTTEASEILAAVFAIAPSNYSHGAAFAAFALCSGVGPAQFRDAGDRQFWTCPVTYTTRPASASNGSGGSSPTSPYSSPLLEPWKISGSYIRGERTTYLDKDDELITLLGTDEIKAVTIPAGNDTLHMEGHTATISLPLRAEAVFKTNSHAMWGLTPRQLLLVSWQYDIRRWSGGQCVYHVLDWEINYDGWTEAFRNASFMEINPDYDPSSDPPSKRLKEILGGDDLPVHEPHPIAADGTPCEAGDAPIVEAEAIKEFNFLTLGFPATLPGPFV